MKSIISKCKEYTLTPKRHPEKKDFSHALYVLILPLYLISFFTVEAIVTENYWVSYMSLDSHIPFLEGFLIPYYMWYPFMGILGVYLLFRDGEAFKKFMSFIGLSFMTAIVIFLVFPNGQDLRPEAFPRNNIFTRAIAGLYTADTNTNVLPSLHVVGSFAVPFAAQNCKSLKKPWLIAFLYFIAVLISISTVFIKQHSILDVIIAVPYSIIFYILVYKVIFRKKQNMN